MLQETPGASSSSAAAAGPVEDLDLRWLFPMEANTQQKRDATTPPSLDKTRKKKKGSKSELIEIGDNPEEAHEAKGPVGRPKQSAKSSSSSSSSSAAAAPAETSKAVKQVGVEKDINTSRGYWKKQNLQYLYQQLELDGMRFTNLQKIGKEDVHDQVLGKKVKKIGKPLKKS